MASFKLLGALAGSSGQALDAIKTRQDEEREERKAKMLEELRRDTAVYLADYQEMLDKDDVKSDLSGFDPSTGEFVSRNKEGKEIGRRLDPGAQEDYEFKKSERGLSLDALRANIEQSKASADSSRASANYSRKNAARLDATASEPVSDMEVADELLYQAKDLVDQAKGLGISVGEIMQTAEAVAQNSRTPDEARRRFRDSVGILVRFKLQDKNKDPLAP